LDKLTLKLFDRGPRRSKDYRKKTEEILMSILLSVISHKQAELVKSLLEDIQHFCLYSDLEVILTINTEEQIHFEENDYRFNLKIVYNERPKGFGANHNAAFKLKESDFFCVVNPDIRLIEDPFILISSLKSDRQIGVIAPLIRNGQDFIEDSARKLPTPGRLIKRVLSVSLNDRLDYVMDKKVYPDWMAGIFLLFPSKIFAGMKGFDEGYHLYFEDVDLCSRLRLSGYQLVLDPSVSVIHEARRDSHRDIRYLKWHVLSGLRFFSSRVFWESLSNRPYKTGKLIS
jgi:N-acetylglucosaminyl-diphospho-decaprenol L-rhamnosyltransferase